MFNNLIKYKLNKSNLLPFKLLKYSSIFSHHFSSVVIANNKLIC